MFEEKQKQPEAIEQKSVLGEPEIFVMPELGEAKAPKKKRKMPSMSVMLGIGGGLFLVALGVFAYIVLRPPKDKPVVTAPQLPIQEPGIEQPQEIEEQPKETATSTPEVPLIPPKAPEVLSFGPDDDSDGITNQEERLIYKSDLLRPDTDGDGFLDGNEVFHLYSPIGPTPVRLLGSGLVSQYDNTEFNYLFYYPSGWTVEQVATSTLRELVVRAPSGELISLTVSDNTSGESLFNWYTREAPSGDITTLEPITTKGGFNALQTSNRLTTYVALPDKIIVASLNIGDKTQVEYRRTYEMLLNSLGQLTR